MIPRLGLVLAPLFFALSWCAGTPAGENDVRLVFMEPDPAAEVGALPAFRVVSGPSRVRTYSGWMENDGARMALDLYARAWCLSPMADLPPVYFVALEKGGNTAEHGFRLRTESGWETHDLWPYIMLAPEDWVFTTTLPHETGHMVLFLINGCMQIPARSLAAIPHTTAALTDRGTAFDEGFAIHLETLLAHVSADPIIGQRYGHAKFLFGEGAQRQSEYYRLSMDLLTFSQSRSRYHEVRENTFAFAPAFKGPDYLRVQLEKSRDYSELRDANQLLQSEGFYASFFFSLMVRGATLPDARILQERQGRMLAALAVMFQSHPVREESPHLLRFVETYMTLYPGEAGEIVDVLLDLSHGVFVDARAAALWRDHYLGAVRLDLAERNNETLNQARREWRAKVSGNPKALYARLGPQIRCEVAAVEVRLVAFGEAAPLSFDVNTAEEGTLRLVPGIVESEVQRWLDQRRKRPFGDVEDFKRRSGMGPKPLAAMDFRTGPDATASQ